LVWPIFSFIIHKTLFAWRFCFVYRTIRFFLTFSVLLFFYVYLFIAMKIKVAFVNLSHLNSVLLSKIKRLNFTYVYLPLVTDTVGRGKTRVE